MDEQGSSIENAIADMNEAELRQFALDVSGLIDAAGVALNEGMGWRGQLSGSLEAITGDVGLA